MPEIPPLIFVSGTDTGVGKTLVTALLALRLQSRGVHVGVMKPFATGCGFRDGELVGEDALWLREVTGVEDELALINPIRLEEPLAPLVAARRAGDNADFFGRARQALNELQARYDCVIVEGVGGLMVPIQQKDGAILTCLDWANELKAPVVVVARRALGTIHHSVATCRLELRPPAHFAGLVFCDARGIDEEVAAQTSPAIIEEMTGLPSLGQVPFLPDASRGALIQAAGLCLRWPY